MLRHWGKVLFPIAEVAPAQESMDMQGRVLPGAERRQMDAFS